MVEHALGYTPRPDASHRDPPVITRMRPLHVVGLLALVVCSCHESLPTRTDPSKVFEGNIRMRYEYDRFRNRLKFDVFVVNVFDETLLDTVGGFRGTLTLWIARDPDHPKTITIGPRDIELSPRFDPVRGTLTMNPGDSLSMVFTWDLVADGGFDLRDSLLVFGLDPTCDFRIVADRESAMAHLDLVVFEQIQSVGARSSTSFCFYDRWIETKVCPLPNVLANGCPHEN